MNGLSLKHKMLPTGQETACPTAMPTKNRRKASEKPKADTSSVPGGILKQPAQHVERHQSLNRLQKRTSQTSHDAALSDVLNKLFARFDNNTIKVTTATTPPCTCPTLLPAEIHCDEDHQSSRTRQGTRPYSEVMCRPTAGVFTNIFSQSQQQSVVLTCLKHTTITPKPKRQTDICLNNYPNSPDKNYDKVL